MEEEKEEEQEQEQEVIVVAVQGDQVIVMANHGFQGDRHEKPLKCHQRFVHKMLRIHLGKIHLAFRLSLQLHPVLRALLF